MSETISSMRQEIPAAPALDPQAVECALGKLWRVSAPSGSPSGRTEPETGDEQAVMRARVANLIVFVPVDSLISEVNETLAVLTTSEPCRALVLSGDREAPDRDIEASVSALCRAQSRGRRQVCCEVITLVARGRYAVELPSAAIPLLVSDLPVFLWWRGALDPRDKLFSILTKPVDRVIIDTAACRSPYEDVKALFALMSSGSELQAAISDLNWARLTSWRALLASFFDAADRREALEQINHVQIDYSSGPESEVRDQKSEVRDQRSEVRDQGPEVRGQGKQSVSPQVAPQALLIAGWLASRLGWSSLAKHPAQEASNGPSSASAPNAATVSLEKDGRPIEIQFHRVERPNMRAGRLARVALRTTPAPAETFEVLRSKDGLYLETRRGRGERGVAARVLRVRNRSTAELLGGEMEILTRDRIYEQAVESAAKEIISQI